MNISRCLYCLGNCDLSVSNEEASYTSPSPELDVRFTFTCEPSYAIYTPDERDGRAKYRKTIKLPRLHSNVRFTRDTMLCHSFIRDSIKEMLRDWPLNEDRLLRLIKVAMERAAHTYGSRPSDDHNTVHVDFSVVVEHKHVVFDADLEEGEDARSSEEVTNDEENNDDDEADEEADDEESDDDEEEEEEADDESDDDADDEESDDEKEEAADDEESDDDDEEEADDEESDNYDNDDYDYCRGFGRIEYCITQKRYIYINTTRVP